MLCSLADSYATITKLIRGNINRFQLMPLAPNEQRHSGQIAATVITERPFTSLFSFFPFFFCLFSLYSFDCNHSSYVSENWALINHAEFRLSHPSKVDPRCGYVERDLVPPPTADRQYECVEKGLGAFDTRPVVPQIV